jgi:DNA-binding SARP family transcriptional activator/WD40 repeat protein
MEFRVLGSIEAYEEGRALALGGPRQRCLLAVLLADAGRVVSLDRLVEAVWASDAPPEAALRTTRTYVSRLRRVIGDRVLTREPGYLIDVAGADVDMVRFEELLTAARAMSGDAAVAGYDEALQVWRGRAFGEFADEWWARPEASRLEELRLVALEERVDVLLAIDRHAEVVPDLERLTAANPYRERSAAQLMVALHRSGREVDAHRAYEAFRRRLADETGLQPSPELMRVDRDIAVGAAAVGTSEERRLRGYVVGEVLGQGAFGTVYRAVQPGLGREVALKVIVADVADDAAFVRRFESEAQLVARLEHPHIVPLYDFWREPGGAYLAFRLLRGGTAADALVRDGPWLLDRIDRFVEEIGSALVAAHGAGVVHRDVKPTNVLFDEAGNTYLTDFGIAQVDADAPDAALTAAGSPHYASPEQVRDRRSTPRSDQYSFAVTVWELLTGEVPFGVSGGAPDRPFPSVRSLRADLPDGVDVVLRTAGAARPDDRFATMAELLLAWRQAVGVPAGARTTAGVGIAPTPRVTAARTLTQIELASINPYKGLQAFREADRIDFHGRSALIDLLAARVAGHPFVTVVGPSGSGKSSLVLAGLVPRLRDDDRVLIATMIPGGHPLDELGIALSRVATRTAPIEPERLASARGITRAVRAIAPERGELVLVLDQLEELWTSSDPTERDLFLAGLADAVEEPNSALRVVATVRADFFDRPLEDRAIGTLVADGAFGVTPMAPDEILEAIVSPAGRVGISFEPGLTAALVAEVAGRPASLPLLQFALTELFDGRDGAVVRLSSYRALGGIAGAITRRADEVYASLDAAGQEAAHELFTRLVVVGDTGADTRRRVRLSELAHVPSAVIDVFGSHRLLAFDRDPATREPTVEVAHEALLVRWPRLQAWLDDDRQWLAVRRHLAAAAESWENGGHEPSELYRGARLTTALDAVDRYDPVLTDRERGLLDASCASRDAEVLLQQRAHRRLRRALGFVAVALVLAIVGGTAAVFQRRAANDNAARAEATGYRAETDRLLATARSLDTQDTSIAALLALEAGRRRGADEVELTATLQQVLSARPSWLGTFPTVGEYAFGLDGTSFLSRTGQGVEVYDLADRHLRARVEHPAARGISGRRLATGADGLVVETAGDQLVDRYRLPDLTPAGAPIVTPGSVGALAMSADGVLVTGHAGGLVVVWDAATGQEKLRLRADDDIARLDISADGSKIVTLTSTSAQVWDAASGQPLGSPIPADAADVALSPHAGLVAVLHRPNGIVYDADDGHQVAVLQSRGDAFRFAGDDRIVLSGSTISVDDATTGAEITSAATACGCDLTVSPDGRTAATGLDGPGLYALDGRELLADAVDAPSMADAEAYSALTSSDDHRRFAIASFGGGTTTLERDVSGWHAGETTLDTMFGTMQPDGRLVMADTDAETATIFDPASGTTSAPFPGPSGRNWAQFAGLSHDGRYETYGSFDGIVTLVDTRTGDVTRLDDLRQLNAGNEFPGSSIVLGAHFSNDDRWLVAAAWSGAAVAWDTTTWRRAAVLEPSIADVNGVVMPTFDPTGRYLVASRGRTSIDLFDATTLAPLRSIPTGVQGLPYHAAFDPTGETLAIVIDTLGVLTFDVDTGERRWAALPGDISTTVVFLDPTTLAVAQPASKRLLVWRLDPDRLRAEACRAAGRNLTRGEWDELGPADEPYRRTCPQFGEPPADPTLSVEQPPTTIQVPDG